MKIIEISKASKPLSDYAKELDDEIIGTKPYGILRLHSISVTMRIEYVL